MEKSLQEQYAPKNKCFGCGPSNPLGLKIRSFANEDGSFTASFSPQDHHQAFENVLSGGICGTLLDCHSNWCAAYSLMTKNGEKTPPCTVTAKFTVELKAPTPMNNLLTITATPIEVLDNKAVVEAEIRANGAVTAKCRGIFIAVKEGHPAYNRW